MPNMLLIMPTLVICTPAAGWQLARRLGPLPTTYPGHGWVVASMIVVMVMTVVALGVLEPANLTVLFEPVRATTPRPRRQESASLLPIPQSRR